MTVSAKVIWLLAFLLAYWGYCIAMGLKGMKLVRSASDYFIAGRRLNIWVFVLAATAASFSGWTVIGHPGMIFRDGFQYAAASFFVIAIPLTGVVFLKRQWILGKRFGYVTPGEMFSDYFKSDSVRLLSVVVALLFSVPCLALQFAAAGHVLAVLTDGLVPWAVGAWTLGLVVVIYVMSGGLRSVAYVDTVQCVVLALGMLLIGVVALEAAGGWSGLVAGLAALAQTPSVDPHPGGSHVSYFAVPGVIQVTAGVGVEEPVGGWWTGAMMLTYMAALLGIQAAPAFTMWAFGTTNPRPFALQQVWASAFGVGLILVVFATLMGVSGHLLGGDPRANGDGALWAGMKERGAAVAWAAPADWGAALGEDPALRRMLETRQLIALVGDGDLHATRAAGADAVARLLGSGDARGLAGATFYRLALPESLAETPDRLVPYYLDRLGESVPWLVGLLAVCALAAMQATGAAFLSTSGSILARDLYKHHLSPSASHRAQRLFGRCAVALVALAALAVATVSGDALVILGGVAVAFAFQLWPALLGVCWWPWLTRQGVLWGLVAGIVGVFFTEAVGVGLMDALGLALWGRWPLTIHSAGWGMLANLLVCLAVSALTQDDDGMAHRTRFHRFLREHASVPLAKRKLVPVGWAAVLVWVYFAIGPGAVIGNTVFGVPAEPGTWLFGIPSIWAWQILLWLGGVGMIRFLAVTLELSTVPEKEIEVALEDIGEFELPDPPERR